MSHYAQESPERQIPWLPEERFELALDSHQGSIKSSAAGNDTLTVTTLRVIRVGRQGGVRTTAILPLDRLTAVEVSDVERDNARLVKGLVALAIGVALGWITWAILAVTLISLLVGGLLILTAVFLLSGYVFPDEKGALMLYANGYMLRQPLLTSQSRRDAYLVAHRLYELMSVTSPAVAVPGVAEQQALASSEPLANDATGASVSSTMGPNGAASMLAAVLTSRFEPAIEPDSVIDVAERVARSVAATERVNSYVSRQIIRNPAHQELAEGDYVWDLEYVAPDRYRVSQTGWAPRGEVRERWVSIGRDFYRLAGTWQKPEDPSRFDPERELNTYLTVGKYLNVLRHGYPTGHELLMSSGKQYLQLRYEPMERESLASILGNPSPPQGVVGAAIIWIDCETELLTKAEVKVMENGDGRQLIFEQAFASFDSGLAIEPPEISTSVE